MKNLIGITILIILTIFILSCGDSDGKSDTKSKDDISIQITRDHGSVLISEKRLPYKKGMTVMDVLVLNFKVETAYNGGFVKSIEGINSTTEAGAGRGRDWFYYVNGEEPKKGAAEYLLEPGDSIKFDFHKWSMESITEKFNSEKE
jgi:hypothetical protein